MKSFLTLLLALVAINTDLYAAEAGMPQLDPTYWASQAFWLVLIFAILYISISKFYLPKIKDNLDNTCIIKGSKGSLRIIEPWKPGISSTIEVTNKKRFYTKTVNSKLSVYANQIENVSKSFLNHSKNLYLFDIEKSLINMKLMSNWLNN